MNYKIHTISIFDKQAKRLSRKYGSMKEDLATLCKELTSEPTKGTPLGNDCYKIRLRITSKGRGKSGGARIITAVVHVSHSVFLLSIFDKSEQSSISNHELRELLAYIK